MLQEEIEFGVLKFTNRIKIFGLGQNFSENFFVPPK